MAYTIVITGASTGFGNRTARKLAALGHTVFATMRHSDGKNKKSADGLHAYASSNGYALHTIDMDVTNKNSVNRAIETIIAQAGHIDVLINNAGIWGPGVLEAYTIEQWQQVFDVNVLGSIRCTRAVLPYFRKQKGGLVIQISSLQARFILPYSGPYVASKWAIDAATEQFRYELASFGIEFTIVQPYDFLTEMKEKAHNYVAADGEREKEYGPTVEFIKQNYLVPDLQRANDPAELVNALVTIIDMPLGSRPVRVTVKNPLGQIEKINALQAEMQTELFGWMNMQSMLSPAVKISNPL
jgi:NAD(P)-dependent dehydrogenase (short-subunit alcohol dehydrogenase family)